MRIEREDGSELGPTWAVLTAEEAHELATALIDYFDALAEGQAEPGWHHHLGRSDQELTIAIEDERIPSDE